MIETAQGHFKNAKLQALLAAKCDTCGKWAAGFGVEDKTYRLILEALGWTVSLRGVGMMGAATTCRLCTAKAEAAYLAAHPPDKERRKPSKAMQKKLAKKPKDEEVGDTIYG